MKYSITIEFEALQDIEYFKKNNKKIALRIKELLSNIEVDPFNGTGKPEQLKFQLSGCWSRRINREHRLVYKIEGKKIRILSCRYQL
jgi:toxin YoeB